MTFSRSHASRKTPQHHSPAGKKKIRVLLGKQVLYAFEGSKQVFEFDCVPGRQTIQPPLACITSCGRHRSQTGSRSRSRGRWAEGRRLPTWTFARPVLHGSDCHKNRGSGALQSRRGRAPAAGIVFIGPSRPSFHPSRSQRALETLWTDPGTLANSQHDCNGPEGLSGRVCRTWQSPVRYSFRCLPRSRESICTFHSIRPIGNPQGGLHRILIEAEIAAVKIIGSPRSVDWGVAQHGAPVLVRGGDLGRR